MPIELTRDIVRDLLPSRPDDAHKGSFGHVLIIAGSRGFTGAARLAAEAAGRSGVGLVTLAVPQPFAAMAAAALLETMWIALPASMSESYSAEAVAPALAAADNKQAVVLGPGISTHVDTRKFVFDFLRQCRAPLVLDADALNIVGINPGVLSTALAPAIVTPHPGEMARLAGITTEVVQRDRESCALQFAARYNCSVVLKGHRTVIASPDGQCAVNPTGNNGMATGGTGDVLAGLIGGLLAQGMSPHDAARVGVFVHGLAGDLAAETMTARGMLARDVLNAIPNAWRTIEGNL